MEKNNEKAIRDAMMKVAELMANDLPGRMGISARASVMGVKISRVLNVFEPDYVERLSDQQAQDLLDYLQLVYSGLMEFCRQQNLEV